MNYYKGNIINNRIWALWVSWACSVGAIVLVILLSLYISKFWLPLVALLFDLSISIYSRYKRANNGTQCFLIPHVCARILFWSALVMVVINLVYLEVIPLEWFESGVVNRDIPYITSLITAPVTAIIAGWALLRRGHNSFCNDCKMRNGDVSERGFIGKLYLRDSRYQAMILFWFAVIHTILSTTYYFVYYINVNLNAPDKFFFVWMPVIFWVLSIIYLGFRYISISIFYLHNESGDYASRERATLVRYLIICDDEIYLRKIESNNGTTSYDTPVKITLPYRERLSDYDAEIYYRNIISSGSGEHRLRFIYRSDYYNDNSKIFHYLDFVSAKNQIDRNELGGEWFNMSQVEQLLNAQSLSPMLSAEIIRVCQITMARKAYHRDGRRIYGIKNYQPSFRLSEIENLDVDFSDPIWLFVAFNNEDRPFYRLRRFWHRYICGIHD